MMSSTISCTRLESAPTCVAF